MMSSITVNTAIGVSVQQTLSNKKLNCHSDYLGIDFRSRNSESSFENNGNGNKRIIMSGAKTAQ